MGAGCGLGNLSPRPLDRVAVEVRCFPHGVYSRRRSAIREKKSLGMRGERQLPAACSVTDECRLCAVWNFFCFLFVRV